MAKKKRSAPKKRAAVKNRTKMNVRRVEELIIEMIQHRGKERKHCGEQRKHILAYSFDDAISTLFNWLGNRKKSIGEWDAQVFRVLKDAFHNLLNAKIILRAQHGYVLTS